jgi:hypothetical protein
VVFFRLVATAAKSLEIPGTLTRRLWQPAIGSNTTIAIYEYAPLASVLSFSFESDHVQSAYPLLCSIAIGLISLIAPESDLVADLAKVVLLGEVLALRRAAVTSNVK